MFGCVWMARGNDCEVVAKIVEEHGGRRFLVITGWGMLGSSHWWLGFGGNDMHWQLEYGDIQSLTSSWQWQEPMLLLKSYPQNKQEGLVRHRLQRFQSSHLQLGHGMPWHFIRKTRAAWKRGTCSRICSRIWWTLMPRTGALQSSWLWVRKLAQGVFHWGIFLWGILRLANIFLWRSAGILLLLVVW